MNRLYVFAIGGSGERVMESLVMMLAAGMPISAQTIVPVFVDNDNSSHALTDCTEMIRYYRSNTPQLTGLHELGEMAYQVHKKRPTFAHVDIDEPVLLSIAGSTLENLRHVIGVSDQATNDIEKSILEERNLLFSDEDLDMQLNYGFVGNPNIGSVVLNSAVFNSPEFSNLKITDNDGVFIIGSLFGGTGAAGFPLIANKYAGGNNAPIIGGVAILPYFDVPRGQNDKKVRGFKGDQKVETESFDSKTRAALAYYDEYMKHVDYMYYVGNNSQRSKYTYCLGGDEQKNPYNLIEVMAALSIVDFSKKTQHPSSQEFRIPSWNFSESNPQLSNLSGIPNYDLKRAFAKFQMLKVIVENSGFLSQLIKDTAPCVSDIKFDDAMLDAIKNYENSTNSISKGLGYFLKKWELWMKDLSDSNKTTRYLTIFNQKNIMSLAPERITTEFHTDRSGEAENYGIAHDVTKTSGFIRKEVLHSPANPDINNEVTSVFNKQGWEKAKVNQKDAIPTLLLEISLALDNVLDNTQKCDL